MLGWLWRVGLSLALLWGCAGEVGGPGTGEGDDESSHEERPDRRDRRPSDDDSVIGSGSLFGDPDPVDPNCGQLGGACCPTSSGRTPCQGTVDVHCDFVANVCVQTGGGSSTGGGSQGACGGQGEPCCTGGQSTCSDPQLSCKASTSTCERNKVL